jgi:ectoine hydroxylase-related dioxygenase (phytanoyl-CoA dioxygenase family)
MATLSQDQVDRYGRDGILFPIRVFSAAEVSLFRQGLEWIAGNSGKDGPPHRFDNLHLFFDWAYQLVSHEAVVNAVEAVLGNDILVDGSLVLWKQPQHSGYVSWHQDSVYSVWHLTPCTSAWIALTPSTSVNGCMRVIPGSHKHGSLDHGNIRDEANMVRRGEVVKMSIDEGQAVDVVLQPGEMSLHHSTTIHGSNPNSSPEPRIGFIVRFVTSQFLGRERPLLRVRGDADCSHLPLATPPAGMNQQRSCEAWRSFQRVTGVLAAR